jgi:hypothetical protein
MYLRTFLQSVFRKVSWCQWTICTAQCAQLVSMDHLHFTVCTVGVNGPFTLHSVHSWCQWTICISQCAHTCSISTQHATWAQGQYLCCSSCSSVYRITLQPQIQKHNKRATVWQRLLKNKNNCTTHHTHKMLYAHNTHTQVIYYLNNNIS